MTDATGQPSSEQGVDVYSAEELLPVVYDELRRLAAARIAGEKPGQTLQPTALVHEAYLKLAGHGGDPRRFADRRHFFAAAARAMGQILVDQARRKMAVRHGGQCDRVEYSNDVAGPVDDPAQTLVIDEMLQRLSDRSPRPAQVAQMRMYLRMTCREVAEVLGISADTVETDWAYARAWLQREWQRDD